LGRLKKFLKEYYGLVPTLGGTIVAGSVGVVAYSVGFAKDFSKELQYILATQDVWGGISSLYNYASSVGGKYIIPAFFIGQVLSYKLKKSVTSFFEK